MKDFEELRLARVVDACGGIDGRVKMQKIIYLLKAMGYDLPFDDFVIRQHGPFSRSVAWATDILKGAEILEESGDSRGRNANGEGVRQYSYAVRENVVAILRKDFDVAAPPAKPAIEEIASRLKTKSRGVLEVAATQVFLEREGLSGDELQVELTRLKGHLSEHFSQAKEFLAELRDEALLCP